jgi:adenosylcobinamide kinase / adenosylcobinamide-phosphate guanylyltransferase
VPAPTSPAKLILVGGGARSGKSRFALRRARELAGADGRVVFIATAEALDTEMTERIRRHRAERDPAWSTIEEPLALAQALRRAGEGQGEGRGAAGGAPVAVVVDCLTLWLSNLFGRGVGPADLTAAFAEVETELGHRRAHVVLVSNEVGLGVVPETPLGRQFRDAAGSLHQRLAARADETYAALMGMVLRLRPGPVEAFPALAAGAAGDEERR